MIAVYARQSVDKADSISIESQMEYCNYEIKGEAFQTYIDRGYSGKNTERPAFQKMMTDMENGLIRKVVVYKLDRISRSILDFSAMMEKFEQYHVKFVSMNEKFDTSAPMGRAMLNICIVFAQLERETIQKRVADAYYSRSQKGLYMGGRVPYGFRLIPATVRNIRTAMYEIHPEEAEQVKLIYELYAKPECSYGDIIRCFEQRDILKAGKPWGRTRLADVLKNPVYVRADLSVYKFYHALGVSLANPPADFIGTNGCYYYKGKDTPGYLVLAPHEGIVPADLWLKCRAKCLAAKQVRPYQKAKNTWLAGKIKCACCGYALVGKHYPTRQSRYFLCSHKMNSRGCTGPGAIYADDFEELIYAEMRKKLALFQKLRKNKSCGSGSELTTLNMELMQLDNEIEALLKRLACADDVMYQYISGRVGELDGKKRELAKRLAELKLCRQADDTEIQNHLTCWHELSFTDKRRTADQLIKVIYAASDMIKIEWRI